MHYVGLALYAEGRTDYYFLRPLLLRLCKDVCLRCASQPVELSEEVISLNEPTRLQAASRDERILGAAKLAQGAGRIGLAGATKRAFSLQKIGARVEGGISRAQHHPYEKCSRLDMISGYVSVL